MKQLLKIVLIFTSLSCTFFSYSYADATLIYDPNHPYVGQSNYVGSYSWANQTTAKDTPLCTSSVCLVSPCLMSSNQSTTYKCSPWEGLYPYTVSVPTNATAEDMQKAFTAKNGLSGIWGMAIFESSLPSDYCFTMVYTQGQYGYAGLFKVPGANCATIKQPPLKCDIDTIENIKFGTLSASKLDGAEALGSVNIICTDIATVKMSLEGTEIILGTPNLTTKLYANGTDLSNPNKVLVKTVKGNTRVPILAVLQKGGPIDAGHHSGSGIITIVYE